MTERTNNDLQITTQKTKDRATRTPLKIVVSSGTPGGLKRMWTSLYCTASSLCLLGGAIITILNMLNKDCTQNFMQQFSAEEGCNLIQCVIKVIK
jgi:hypothetical protein